MVKTMLMQGKAFLHSGLLRSGLRMALPRIEPGTMRQGTGCLSYHGEQFRDWRRTRLFGPIVLMTVGGLAMLVLLSVMLVQRFDLAASAREQIMVEQGFARQLQEFDAVIATQVDWDDAITKLDNKFDPNWADFNVGNYLHTFNGFTRAFVVDGGGQPF
jgi:hypothetical protein